MSTLSQFTGGGQIKSIQSGVINLGASSGGTATITAVDTTKSILYHLGTTNGIISVNQVSTIGGPSTFLGGTTSQARLELTNSTTITASAVVTTPGPAAFSVISISAVYGSVSWRLVEYY